ncbi:UNVERIFIED_CONTAM: hypothetical protein FKN15_018314 [Acipenser sinensis]
MGYVVKVNFSYPPLFEPAHYTFMKYCAVDVHRVLWSRMSWSVHGLDSVSELVCVSVSSLLLYPD